MMPRMNFASHVSYRALGKVEAPRRQHRTGDRNHADNSFSQLRAVESTSILGRHNGVMDDDLMDALMDSVA